MKLAAGIDIGSNAIRLVIGGLCPDGTLRVIEDRREAIRLGQDSFGGGQITPETTIRVVEAFDRFEKSIREHGVMAVRAVATSAMREAANRDDVIKQIRVQSGIGVEVIRGEEEAELIYAAVASAVDLRSGLALLIDIGGGSVEVTLVKEGDVVRSESAPMGTVRLLKLMEGQRRPVQYLNRLIREYAHGIKQQIAQELEGQKLQLAAGTGGNIESLGELRETYLKKRGTDEITVIELEDILEKLQELSYEERIETLNLKADRADVILPAAAVLLTILQQAKIPSLTIPHVGLKEGVLRKLLENEVPATKRDRKRQLLHLAEDLGQKYHYDELHAKTVAKHAVSIFDQTAILHGYGSDERLLLELGALLHDIGQFVTHTGHHKHSAYLINACHFVGLSEREQHVVAAIARYHRKSAPKPSHPEYARLDEEDRRRMLVLAAITRVADAFDRGHASNVSGIKVKFTETNVVFRAESTGDLALERWAVEKKCKLFEEVFQRQLIFQE